MQTIGLFHLAIKTVDLDATVKFYSEVLGLTLAPRPDFGFPGAWLALGDGTAIIHVYAGSPALVDGKAPDGTGAVDHLSLMVRGWDECLARVQATGREWRAQIVPGTNLWQLFVHDPSGLLLELTFDGDKEGRPRPEIANERRYMSGKQFVSVTRMKEPT
ncbi:VOC family protein [Pseudorhodoplanes sp.]|uniref:VOC family protein n=1 Tax=Pseudorhodoplanes sp. TaxID=1934341 RepID=UPI002BCBFF20|nr:VOC family protein [Pseudorhodoplanes sp.]HWV51115.1 VOC family protein [Pseudorhodoplanes sp.]